MAAVPFLLLRQAGHPVAALFATIAVLNLSIADTGGSYRQRLTVMLAIAVIMPLILIAGMHARQWWWLAVLLTFLVSLGGGISRLFGTAGTSVGLVGSIVFLIALEVPASFLQSLQDAGFYLSGALWAILVALAVWRLRPYRRIRYEIGECFRQLAVTLRTLRVQGGEDDFARESQLVLRRQQVRNALEQARQGLGDALSVASPPPFLSELIVLLRAASRIDAVAAGLGGTLSGSVTADLPGELVDALSALLRAFEDACSAIGTALLDRAPVPDFSALHEHLRGWNRLSAEVPQIPSIEEVQTFIDVIARQLENAQHVTDRLSEVRNGARGLLPPLHGPAFPYLDRASLRANLSLDSLVLRHALRVAVAAAAGTAIYVRLRVPHGIWIPLTVLIVLQPQLGATLSKAVQRIGGTLLGAAIAALLVFLFRGTMALDVAVLVCLFLTLFLFRNRYWLAVAFLTPLIILLLDLITHQPWTEIVSRVGDTLAGAVLALLAGYALWPSWEARWLPGQIADAIGANREYFAALHEAAIHGLQPDWPLAGLRARVELTATNARAGLERMLTEPRGVRWKAQDAVSVVTHLERLGRHITRLSIYLHETPGQAPSFGAVGEALAPALQQLEDAVRSARPPPADDSLDHAWVALERTRLQAGHVQGPDSGTVDMLLGSIISDINSLRAALGEGISRQ